MFPAPYKIFFRKTPTGDYYTVDGSGAVITTATATPIPNLPKGWEAPEIPISRSTENLGLLTQTTSSYKFTLDAAKILRYINYTYGPAADCFIEVWKTESTNQTYFLQHKGQFDFKTFNSQGEYVEVDIEQGGLNALLYREEDTVQEIPITPTTPGVIPTFLDGVALRNKSMVRMVMTYDDSQGKPSRPPVLIVDSESNIGVSVVANSNTTRGSIAEIEAAPFMVASVGGTITIEWDFFGRTWAANPTFRWGIWATINRGGTTVNRQIMAEGTAYYNNNGSQMYVGLLATGTTTLTVQTGDIISVYGAGIQNSSGTLTPYDLDQASKWERGILNITYNTRQAQTVTPAFRYGQVVEKLIAKIDATATVAANVFNTPGSSLLDCSPYNLLLAPSESVRGITDAKYKLAWKDIEKDLQRYGLAASADSNTVNIRPVTDFFEDAEMAHLGTIPRAALKVVPALKYLFAKLKAGCKAGDNDALQGRFAINAPQLWEVLWAKVEGERDMVSPFISDMYAIEQIRSNRVKDTTNQSDDNRIILLDATIASLNGSLIAGPRRPQNDGGNYAHYLIDSAAEETAFNLSQSPTRDIMRNGAIMAVQTSYGGSQVNFVSAEREGTMMAQLDPSTGGILERSVVNPYNPPFLPVLFQSEAPAPIGFYTAFATNPHRFLSFYVDGILYKGYIDEVKLRPGGTRDEGTLQYSLLAHPSTDLTTLIY